MVGPQRFTSASGKTYLRTREEQLGEGGPGLVVPVKDENGELLALKYLKEAGYSTQRRKRFEQEARICTSMSHPNIVRVLDYGVVNADGNERPFYVMKRFHWSLRRAMNEGAHKKRRLHIFRALLSGLEAAHDNGIWHRDQKPENVLCDQPIEEVVIADFGIAHLSDQIEGERLTKSNELLGSRDYAAPEQRNGGPVDQRCDIYTLGLILNEMFTGQLPLGTGYRPIASVEGDFASLDPIVAQMIRQQPDDRYQSISAVREALNPNVGDLLSAAHLTVARAFVARRLREEFIPIPRDPLRGGETHAHQSLEFVGITDLGTLGIRVLRCPPFTGPFYRPVKDARWIRSEGDEAARKVIQSPLGN